MTWLDSGEPFSDQFQDFYFSTEGGLQETEYVFLKQNGFPQRFIDLNLLTHHKSVTQQPTIHIGETGFGTGLNFLVTAYHFLQYCNENCSLNYTAIEKYPLSTMQLERVYQVFEKSWPQLGYLCQELALHYSSHQVPSKYNNSITLFDGRIHLHLIIDDATKALKDLADNPSTLYQHRIDAWFLDGFAPAKNPDMWQDNLFDALAKLSRTGTTMSTFTSAGIVRRGLIEAGFKMKKAPGLGKKREILAGVLV
nr:tRNA (5-methylaminomethyl-2-thiouridine)(34)-methyltransferase MnmD [sulfur-oxidizing endosymbiont of Gigantopelta aegis]